MLSLVRLMVTTLESRNCHPRSDHPSTSNPDHIANDVAVAVHADSRLEASTTTQTRVSGKGAIDDVLAEEYAGEDGVDTAGIRDRNGDGAARGDVDGGVDPDALVEG